MLSNIFRHRRRRLLIQSPRFFSLYSNIPDDDALFAELPGRRRRNWERKPYPTPMKELIRRAKEEKELRKALPCRLLEHPPDNGLLVPELVDVAKQVYRARGSLLMGISKLIQFVSVHRCRCCFEVHIGPIGHEIRTCTGPRSGFRSAMHSWRRGAIQDVVFFPKCYHLYDRVGNPRVTHKERTIVPRLPAIVELCIQAGLDLCKYPTTRRTKPVYSIEGRIVELEVGSQMDDDMAIASDQQEADYDQISSPSVVNDISEVQNIHPMVLLDPQEGKQFKDIISGTMQSWHEMISGAKKIMDKYTAWTCGYCPEIQVGPKGHKARNCKASKHQNRDGMHAWQEATIDDLVGPNYVWHVPNSSDKGPLRNDLKRYYGKAPAVVELCVQAGADIPLEYRAMMRLDVVPPAPDEVDLVA